MLSSATFQMVVNLLSVSRFLLQFRVDIRHFPREDCIHVDSKAKLYDVYECVWIDERMVTFLHQIPKLFVVQRGKRWL